MPDQQDLPCDLCVVSSMVDNYKPRQLRESRRNLLNQKLMTTPRCHVSLSSHVSLCYISAHIWLTTLSLLHRSLHLLSYHFDHPLHPPCNHNHPFICPAMHQACSTRRPAAQVRSRTRTGPSLMTSRHPSSASPRTRTTGSR